MKRLPWELFLILILLAVVSVAIERSDSGRQQAAPLLTSDSPGPEGAGALYLWLQSLGYKVERLEYHDFQLDENTSVLLLLAPTEQPKRNDLSSLRRWVDRGGTLIIAAALRRPSPELLFQGPSTLNNPLSAFLTEFGLHLEPLEDHVAYLAPSQPLLMNPPVHAVRLETGSYISGSTSLVNYLGESKQPAAIGLPYGKGRVYVLASNFALSNEGLKEPDNAAFILNWLPGSDQTQKIAFDEIHHGRLETPSLLYRMAHEAWGWAVLYVLGIIFLYLLLGGRRFGRAVPKIVDTRRVAAEYVISLANLLRQGGKSDWVARHYEQALRLELASACNLGTSLTTNDLADRLLTLDKVTSNVTGSEARLVLLALKAGGEKRPPEGKLLKLVAEAGRIIRECRGRRK